MSIFDDSIDLFFDPETSDLVTLNGSQVYGVFSEQTQEEFNGLSTCNDSEILFYTATKYLDNMTTGDSLKYKDNLFTIIDIKQDKYGFSSLSLSRKEDNSLNA